MAKSNAQRQAEYRARKNARRLCEHAGCWRPSDEPSDLCTDHRAQAREKFALLCLVTFPIKSEN